MSLDVPHAAPGPEGAEELTLGKGRRLADAGDPIDYDGSVKGPTTTELQVLISDACAQDDFDPTG